MPSLSKASGTRIALIAGMDNSVPAGGVTVFVHPSGGESGSWAGESMNEMIIPRAGTLNRLAVRVLQTNGANDSTVTVRVNGADTALVATVPGGALGGSSIATVVASVAVAAGDRVAIEVTTGAAGLGRFGWTFEYLPS